MDPEIQGARGRAYVTFLLASTAVSTAFGHSPGEPTDGPRPGAEVIQLEPFVVTGKAEDLVGLAFAASKGQSDHSELQERPYLRRGELIEVVPGMVITQHSGGGKANQYFLRGFNLDHGTDFGIFVDGMPVNKRTHGHGQGYADVNFVVPELVRRLDYFKGSFDARHGDLSAAGAANFETFDILPGGIATVTIGENGYYRGMVGDSFETESGAFSGALEMATSDGPWVLPENFKRINLFGRFFRGTDTDHWSLTAMGYSADWDATDQVPQRLIEDGTIDRLGFIDPTVGGSSHRYSISSAWQKTTEGIVYEAEAYLGTYQLDLFSNFTYLLENPDQGDQFNQYDDRVFAGLNVSASGMAVPSIGEESFLAVGLQTHHDFINDVGLYPSAARERIGKVREDNVYEMNFSGFAEISTVWSDWFRSQLGLRADSFLFDVTADVPANSGREWSGILSPKASLVLGPWEKTEFYLNASTSFHSNDARGVTIAVDPVSGEPVDPVDPLVRLIGAEVGLRSSPIEGFTGTVALWYLESDSELIYVGDAGNVEAGDASERYGIEIATYWRPIDWLYVDAELTLTEARFKESGEEIENSVPATFSGGLTAGRTTGVFGSIRARYFSERPLNGDGSIESQDAFQINLRFGWRTDRWEAALQVLNVFDAKDNDIEYYYASRVDGEPIEGIEDIHLHPFEPRQFRVTVSYYW